MMGRRDLRFRDIPRGLSDPEQAINHALGLLRYAAQNPLPLRIYSGPAAAPDPARWAGCLIYVQTVGSVARQRWHYSDGTSWIALDGSDTALAIPTSGWHPERERRANLPIQYLSMPAQAGLAGSWAQAAAGNLAIAASVLNMPMPLHHCTRAQLPDPSVATGRLCFVTDEPVPGAGPFPVSTHIRMAFQNGSSHGWFGLNDSSEPTATPVGGWATAPLWGFPAIPDIDTSLAAWDTVLLNSLNEWRTHWIGPTPIPPFTRAAFATYASTATANWRGAVAMITNPLNASVPRRGDEMLVVSDAGQWRRLRDSTAAV